MRILRTKQKYDKKEELQCYLMIAIPIIGFFVFTLYPLIWAARLSFFSYTGIPSETRMIGLANYIKLFADPSYWRAWGTTLQIAAIKIPIEYVLGFLIANMLSHGRKGADFFRSAFYLPAIVSTAIVGFIFSNLFEYFGPINVILSKIGFIGQNVDWFSQKGTALAALVTSGVWHSLGTMVMYFMAALATVPLELYESADIEGAGSVTKFFKITIPMIAPILQIVLMLSIISMLGVNESILVMTNGAPAGSTHSVMSYITSRVVPGFGIVSNLGYSSAMCVVTSVIVCVIALLYNLFSRKMKNLY